MLDHSSSPAVGSSPAAVVSTARATRRASAVVPSGDDAHGPSDLLTRVLLNLRLDGVEYGRCLLRRPWAVAFPAHAHAQAQFHFIARGACWLQVEGQGWTALNVGDAVLLPRGTAHVLASEPDLAPITIDDLARRAVADNIYLVEGARCGSPRAPETIDGSDDDARDVLFCGTLRFNLDAMHPLMAMMPDVMRAADLSQRDPTVPALLEAMEREVALDRIGACAILARMADVLAASIIRAWVECACNDATGWIAALQCPRIGRVIAAVHAAPEREWTVEALAALMGASRSSFAQAFTDAVGDSPARYVAKVRMSQARRWIEREGMRVAVAAERLGYDSEASFSRAFKRVMGVPPSAVRSVRRTGGLARPAAPSLSRATATP